MRIPLFIAKLRILAITLGIAKPTAHGHEATRTPIPLSITQENELTGTRVRPKLRITVHAVIVITLKTMTVFTK
jgi:hypothetical protein